MFVFNTVVIATHRRSGNQWAIDALRHNSPDINDSFMALDQIEKDHGASIPLAKFRRQLLNLDGQVLINVHDLPSADNWKSLDERLFVRTILHNSPTIYVHRDGRDVLLSLYYYMKSFSETVRNQSFSRFLRGESALAAADSGMSRPAYWAFHVNAWLARENVLSLAYHDLETNYDATVQRMAGFLGVKLNARLQPVNTLGRRQSENVLDSVLGRLGVAQRLSARGQYRRNGRSGEWRRVFDKQDRAFFIKEAGETLRQLNYEK